VGGTGSSASELLETLSVSAASGAGSPASELSSTGVSRTKIKERSVSWLDVLFLISEHNRGWRTAFSPLAGLSLSMSYLKSST
jgi:hypothetical protein